MQAIWHMQVNFPRVWQAAGAGTRAAVVESISESEALLRADRDRCSGWQRRAVVCSRRSPRGPLVLPEAPQLLQSRPAPAEQQPFGLPADLWGCIFAETLGNAAVKMQSGTGSTTRPCTQKKPLRPQHPAQRCQRSHGCPAQGTACVCRHRNSEPKRRGWYLGRPRCFWLPRHAFPPALPPAASLLR